METKPEQLSFVLKSGRDRTAAAPPLASAADTFTPPAFIFLLFIYYFRT